MSYVKTTWATGDVVTSAKLNNMENGIAGAYAVEVFQIVYDEDNGNYNFGKSYNDLLALVTAGKLPVVYYIGDLSAFTGSGSETACFILPLIKLGANGDYSAHFNDGSGSNISFSAMNAEANLSYIID